MYRSQSPQKSFWHLAHLPVSSRHLSTDVDMRVPYSAHDEQPDRRGRNRSLWPAREAEAACAETYLYRPVGDTPSACAATPILRPMSSIYQISLPLQPDAHRWRETRDMACGRLDYDTHRGELRVAAKAGRLELVQIGYLIQRKGIVVGHWEEEPETCGTSATLYRSAPAAVHHTMARQSLHTRAGATPTKAEMNEERTFGPDEAMKPPSSRTPRNP